MHQFFLNDAELELIEAVRFRAQSGLYRLSDLFGDLWESIKAKTSFGIRFKRTVDAGHLPGIAVYGKTVENHQLYYIS